MDKYEYEVLMGLIGVVYGCLRESTDKYKYVSFYGIPWVFMGV